MARPVEQAGNCVSYRDTVTNQETFQNHRAMATHFTTNSIVLIIVSVPIINAYNPEWRASGGPLTRCHHQEAFSNEIIQIPTLSNRGVRVAMVTAVTECNS